MPGTTPTFGLPYQTSSDQPDGPVLGQQLAEAVEAVLSGSAGVAISPTSITNPAKIAVTYQNSWVDWGAPYQGARYWRDKNGVVHIDGLIKSGSVTATATIFTLPAGYRPAANLIFMVGSGAGFAASRLDVLPSGAVQVGAAGWSNSLASISGVSFKAEQ